MAFGAGGRESRVFEHLPSKEEIRRGRMEVACACWFTSRGDAMPLSVKFPGEDGSLITVRDFHVDWAEKRYDCGTLAVEYACRMGIRGRRIPVRLIFYPEECRWVMEMEEG